MFNNLRKIVLVILFLVLSVTPVYASGDYNISLSSTNVSQGKSVNLYIKGNNIAGGFTITSSDSTVASVATSSAWVDNNTATISISTLKVGSSTITVRPTSVSDYDGNDLSLGAKSVTINVGGKSNTSNSSQETVKKNSDNTLKELSIDGLNLTPDFNASTTSYTVTAPSDVEKINIKATPNDSKATVTGNGEQDVSAGANNLEIVVTAENGATKTYTITLNVLEKDPIEIKIGKKKYTVVRKIDDLPDVALFEKCDVEVGNEKVTGYYNEKLNIYLLALKDEKGKIGLYIYDNNKKSYVKYEYITEGKITLYLNNPDKIPDKFKKYNVMVKNTSVDVYKISKSDSLGIVYGTNIETGHKGWYVFDKKEQTLARYYDKEALFYKKQIESYKNYLMILAGIVSVIIIVVVIISLVKGKKKHRRR